MVPSIAAKSQVKLRQVIHESSPSPSVCSETSSIASSGGKRKNSELDDGNGMDREKRRLVVDVNQQKDKARG